MAHFPGTETERERMPATTSDPHEDWSWRLSLREREHACNKIRPSKRLELEFLLHGPLGTRREGRKATAHLGVCSGGSALSPIPSWGSSLSHRQEK